MRSDLTTPRLRHLERVPRVYNEPEARRAWRRFMYRLGSEMEIPNDSEAAQRISGHGAQRPHTLRRAQQPEHALGQVDPVTGLPNRAFFRHLLAGALRRQHAHPSAALLYVDIDRFREINEELGSQVGDEILVEVASRLQVATGATEHAARITADQFAVLLPSVAGVEDAKQKARSFLQSLARPLRLSTGHLFVSASVGIALHAPGETGDDLTKHALVAMRRAKGIGRNRYRCYGPEMVSQAARRLSLETELGHALERNQFRLFYQPVIDVASGEVVGAEALLRWVHPQRGLVSPGLFIPALEETGLIVPVGDWVLNEVCRQGMAWQQAGLPPLRIAANIAAMQFLEADLAGGVARALRSTGFSAQHLALEITESALLEDAASTRTSLAAIKNMGVHIALDDFGTGYSSLSYLTRYPIDALKIDRSFVRDIPQDGNGTAIASAVVAMAKSLRLEVVAEGIETEAQLQFLRAQGCHKYQGFYAAKPMSAEDMEVWLRERAGCQAAA